MKKIDSVKIGLVILAASSVGCATSGGGENAVGSAMGSADRGLTAVEQTAQAGGQAIQSGNQVIESGTAATNVLAGQASLTDTLVSQLGVSPQQALGGSGAIFQAAQTNMDPQAFTSLSESVPGMNEMLSAAPDASGGAASGVSSMLGGDSSLGSMTSLASSFQQLNLSPDMVGQFIPVVTNYVQSTGGQAMSSLLQSALPIP